MSGTRGDRGRLRRVLHLRTAWRKGAPNQAEPDEPADQADERATAADAAEEQQRRSDALDSNDRIRAEAPDDLETRRRADQLEREIKRGD